MRYWHRLLREAVGARSLEVFTVRLLTGAAPALVEGGWNKMGSQPPSNPNHSMMGQNERKKIHLMDYMFKVTVTV